MSSSNDLPDWLRGDPIAEALHADGQAVTKATWLLGAYGTPVPDPPSGGSLTAPP